MTDQVQVIETSANAIAQAAQSYLAANVGHYASLCGLAYATALLQVERNASGQPELSSGTAAERATAAFEEALLVSQAMKPKTIDNVARVMRKACAFAITRMQKEKTLYTLDLSPELFGAEFETLEGFAPNLRDIEKAVSEANGTARKAKAKAKEGSTEAANEAANVKAEASVTEKVADAIKTLATLASNVENHDAFQSDEMGDLIALIVKIRREGSQSAQSDVGQAA